MTSDLPRPNWPADWPFRPGSRPVDGREGMVASTDRYATRAGADVLEDGGNAVDAAVAVAFALAVVNPEAGNLGGSGFLLAHFPGRPTAALDFRGRAPSAATPGTFVSEDGSTPPSSEVGHLAVAVPGSVRGLWDAHVRFGSLPWKRLVEPAIALAEGFVVDSRLLRSYEPHIVAALRAFPASAAIFLPNGDLPRDGSVLRQADLARTLEGIRDRGADGFYLGETADMLVAEIQRGGGIMTHDDLASYTAAWREPVRFPYRGRTILSAPPASSGGITIAAAARILSTTDVGSLAWHGTEHVHLLAEAWRRAFADRNRYLADPDHASLPLDVLTSAAYGAWRASSIDARSASRSADVGPGVEAFLGAAPVEPVAARREGRHTTHLSVVDRHGGAVAFTTTLNTWYGSKVVAEGTGVLLNNEMDDFTVRPGEPNFFGLVQGEANAIAPGKRMLSAMTPTLVLDEGGRLSHVLGTPGGATIITTISQLVSSIVDHGLSLADAVAAPRVHHQHLPDLLQVEPGGLPASVVRELEAIGHEVRERPELSGDVQAIAVRADGALEGAPDPRRGGVAIGL
ncbi:MAG: gamma-glutamyltransferase [Gemmatimonadales bacterium]